MIDKDTASAIRAVAITPHASTTFAPCRAVYVGVSGNLVAVPAGQSSEVTFVGVQAGIVLPVQLIRVAPASTAGSLLALY